MHSAIENVTRRKLMAALSRKSSDSQGAAVWQLGFFFSNIISCGGGRGFVLVVVDDSRQRLLRLEKVFVVGVGGLGQQTCARPDAGSVLGAGHRL